MNYFYKENWKTKRLTDSGTCTILAMESDSQSLNSQSTQKRKQEEHIIIEAKYYVWPGLSDLRGALNQLQLSDLQPLHLSLRIPVPYYFNKDLFGHLAWKDVEGMTQPFGFSGETYQNLCKLTLKVQHQVEDSDGFDELVKSINNLPKLKQFVLIISHFYNQEKKCDKSECFTRRIRQDIKTDIFWHYHWSQQDKEQLWKWEIKESSGQSD